MSVCGEKENTEFAIARLSYKISNTSLNDSDRKKLECDLAYEQHRLQQLNKVSNKS